MSGAPGAAFGTGLNINSNARIILAKRDQAYLHGLCMKPVIDRTEEQILPREGTNGNPCRTYKGAMSRFVHLEKIGLNFSSSSFAIRVNLLHP